MARQRTSRHRSSGAASGSNVSETAFWLNREHALQEILAASLPFAIGIAASPIPVIAIVVILSSNAGNALGFLVGWAIGIIAISAIVLFLPGLETSQNEPTVFSGWLRIAFGGLLIWLAFRKWRSRPEPQGDPEVPKLLSRLEKAGAGRVIVVGILLSAINPKVIGLTFGGVTNIDAYATNAPEKAVAITAFAVVSSLTVIVPIVITIASAEHAAVWLPKIKKWLIRNNSAVSSIVLLVLGVLLAGNGIMIAAI